MVDMDKWPTEERPRERMISSGVEGLTDADLVAILIGVGGRGRGNASQLALELLGAFGGLAGLEKAGVQELSKVAAVGVAKACRIKAALALGRRSVSANWNRGEAFRSARDVYQCYGPLLGGLKKEVFLAIPLDTRNRRLGEVRVAEGTLTSCPVHPREAFVPLMRECAAAAVFIHNHPSGDPTPSGDDIALTIRLRDVGELIGIRVLDHVVVASEGYVSLAERGVIK